jgi:hypothetical protein
MFDPQRPNLGTFDAAGAVHPNAMEQNSTTTAATSLFVGEGWFGAIEAELRDRVRQFFEEMIDQEDTSNS